MAKITIGPGIFVFLFKVIKKLFKHDDPPSPPQPSIEVIRASGQDLTYQGRPWKMVADSAWFMADTLPLADVGFYLDTRKSQGFNSFIIGCLGHFFDKTVAKPDIARFERLDFILNEIERRNMWAILCPRMNQAKSYMDGILHNKWEHVCYIPKSEAMSFGQFFAKRYKNQRCLAFWMVGGLDDKGIVSNIDIMHQAEGIRSVDSERLITFHPRARRTTLDAFPVGPNHQIVLYQSYHDVDPIIHKEKLSAMRAQGVPYANIEGPFDEHEGMGAAQIKQVVEYTKKYNVFGFAYGNIVVCFFVRDWKNHLHTFGVQTFLEAIK